MGGVKTLKVNSTESGMRVDRWFKQHFPGLGYSQLQKILRTGQVRVDGGRVKAAQRLEEGQEVRVPPLGPMSPEICRPKPVTSKADARDLKARVLHRDKDILVINKPPGLAVQGGSGIRKNLDAMLDSLCFDSPERPRLVHRLDKDTSGVLVLARNTASARKLNAAFRSRDVRKLYWAVVAGVPGPEEGMIDLSLAKKGSSGAERVIPDNKGGKKAKTYFRVIDQAGRKAAWVAFEPLTGRTHQLRVHAIALDTPILGDGKYGGSQAFLEGEDIAKQLHLHAKAIRIPKTGGGYLEISAPLPEHMQKTFSSLGFTAENERELFIDSNELKDS
ncbi:MAG: RluA family pseudouridine synthase [Rhodospirillales bacterium]|nr:RluA family pseudouridine synthase [Rhodospirillales bacterium]